jgi:ankyrin repeat protein
VLARTADANTIELLIDATADPNTRGEWAVTPLVAAAWRGNEQIVRRLVAKGADITMRSADGVTPLHAAADGGHPAMVAFLLGHGADAKATTNNGRTPLHAAASSWSFSRARNEAERTVLEKHKIDILSMLLDAGADVDATWGDRGATPLGVAADGCPESILRLLISRGANPNVSVDWLAPHSPTLLLKAVRQGNGSFAEFLLLHGAKVDAVYEGGTSLLNEAVRAGNVQMVRALLEHGANAGEKSPTGVTLLHSAALHGHKGIVELLLAYGADPHAQDVRSRTPLDEAVRRGHDEVAKLLKGYLSKNQQGGP